MKRHVVKRLIDEFSLIFDTSYAVQCKQNIHTETAAFGRAEPYYYIFAFAALQAAKAKKGSGKFLATVGYVSHNEYLSGIAAYLLF